MEQNLNEENLLFFPSYFNTNINSISPKYISSILQIIVTKCSDPENITL